MNRVEMFRNHLRSGRACRAVRLGTVPHSWALLLAVLLGCFVPSSALDAQSGPFLDLSAIGVEKEPLAVATGDLNGDGKPDIAVSNSLSGTVSVMMGNGDGTYQSPVDVTLPFNANPGPIAIADLNRDGKQDLIVGFSNATSLVVLLGNGDGTFQPGVSRDSGGTINSILVGDFTGDGIPDVVTVGPITGNPSIEALALFPGKGDGSFGLALDGNLGFQLATNLDSMSAADFDQNGTLDLVLVGSEEGSGLVSILSNDGTGKLTPGTLISLPSGAQGVTTGDFNGDGRVDLAVTIPSTATVDVFIGNGNGTFQAAVPYSVEQAPQNLIAADLNADGKLDLVISNSNDSTLSILLGNGDGTFKTPTNYPTLLDPFGLAAADLNHDGFPDVVVVSLAQNAVQVFLDTPTGSLRTGTYGTGLNPIAAVTGDFNGDGLPDIAVLNSGDNTLTGFFGDGKGGFTKTTVTDVCNVPEYPNPSSIVAGRFQSLTNDQVYVICIPSNPANPKSISLLYTWNQDNQSARLSSFLVDATSFSVADLNGDGYAELLFADPTGALGYVLGGPSSTLSALSLGTNGAFSAIATGDFNGDGRADVGLVSNAGSTGTFFLSSSSGAFTTVNDTFPSVGTALTGDFNGDGLSDILLNTQSDGSAVELSNGDGSFTPGAAINLAPSVFVGAIGDFNGDGIPDLVTENPGYDILLGTPDGSFEDSKIAIGTPEDVPPLVADFDQDGSADLALINFFDNTITVLLNKNRLSPTMTSLSNTSAGGLVVGEPVSLSASVMSKEGPPTGEVVFKLAGVPQTSAQLAGGSAQSSISAALSAGSHRFTALYTGDGTYSGSLSSALFVTINQAKSITILTSTPSAPKLGQTFSVTAVVTPQFGGMPTGTIQFYNDGEPFASSSIVSGQASATLDESVMGKHKIEATYSGDGNFVTSAGVLAVTVGKAVSTVTLSSSANPAFFGSPVTVTASVTDSEGAIATGPVVFKEGTTIYGTVSLSGGSAQFTLPSLAIGSHKITAQYGGDTEDGSTNGTLTEVIQGAPTTTTVVTNVQPSIFGQNVTFTATISSAAGTPDGTLTFKNGSVVLGTVTVSGGQALVDASTLTAGTHTITASYNGGTAYAASAGALQEIVEKAATTMSLSSSMNPATTGTTVTFTAIVSSTSAQLPTGNVTFKSGKTTLGTAALINGQAQLSTSLLPKGTQTITASYAATANFAASNGSLAQLMQ